jgi:hypothetical protein
MKVHAAILCGFVAVRFAYHNLRATLFHPTRTRHHNTVSRKNITQGAQGFSRKEFQVHPNRHYPVVFWFERWRAGGQFGVRLFRCIPRQSDD